MHFLNMRIFRLCKNVKFEPNFEKLIPVKASFNTNMGENKFNVGGITRVDTKISQVEDMIKRRARMDYETVFKNNMPYWTYVKIISLFSVTAFMLLAYCEHFEIKNYRLVYPFLSHIGPYQIPHLIRSNMVFDYINQLHPLRDEKEKEFLMGRVECILRNPYAINEILNRDENNSIIMKIFADMISEFDGLAKRSSVYLSELHILHNLTFYNTKPLQDSSRFLVPSGIIPEFLSRNLIFYRENPRLSEYKFDIVEKMLRNPRNCDPDIADILKMYSCRFRPYDTRIPYMDKNLGYEYHDSIRSAISHLAKYSGSTEITIPEVKPRESWSLSSKLLLSYIENGILGAAAFNLFTFITLQSEFKLSLANIRIISRNTQIFLCGYIALEALTLIEKLFINCEAYYYNRKFMYGTSFIMALSHMFLYPVFFAKSPNLMVVYLFSRIYRDCFHDTHKL